MYKIIGADKIEYGPATIEEVAQWLKEGRADANTLAQQDGGSWQPLFTFPEFSHFFAPPLKPAGRLPATEEILAGDYEVDIMRCVERGWNLVRANFMTIVLFTLVMSLLNYGFTEAIGWFARDAQRQMVDIVVAKVKSLGNSAVTAPPEMSTAGLVLVALAWLLTKPVYSLVLAVVYGYYLKLIRGQPATLADGFRTMTDSFGSLVSLGFFSAALILGASFFCVLPGIYFSVALMFAVPLVCDRRLSFGQAIRLSVLVANKHWFWLLGLLIVTQLVMFSGILGACVGIFVTIPIGHAAFLYAYEDIFGRKTN